MCLLRLLPAAELLVDGDEADLGKMLRILRGHAGLARTVVVACRDFLPLVRVQVFQVGAGNLGRTMLGCVLLDHGDRRFGQYADGRRNDLELVLPQLLDQ